VQTGNTVDVSEIPNNHPTCMKPCKSWDINTISTGFLAGFLVAINSSSGGISQSYMGETMGKLR